MLQCAKIADMFAGGAAVEGEDSSSGQERSSQRCRLTDRESVVQPVSR